MNAALRTFVVGFEDERRYEITVDDDAILDYQFDWSRWLRGDTISTSTWEYDSPLTEPAAKSNTTTHAKIWLQGQLEGVTYRITNRIVTAAGRRDERTFHLRCRER